VIEAEFADQHFGPGTWDKLGRYTTINGGRRGFLIGLAPQVCVQLLGAQSVQCAIDK